MKRLLIASFVLFAPAAALAQGAPQPNSQAEIAAFLARSLSQLAGDNDALHAQIADLQKQLADAKAKPQETPK